jgi:hypothetical protein
MDKWEEEEQGPGNGGETMKEAAEEGRGGLSCVKMPLRSAGQPRRTSQEPLVCGGGEGAASGGFCSHVVVLAVAFRGSSKWLVRRAESGTGSSRQGVYPVAIVGWFPEGGWICDGRRRMGPITHSWRAYPARAGEAEDVTCLRLTLGLAPCPQ